MKIGIITSGNDMLTLFKFLTKYDHEYILYYDQSHGPYGDHLLEESLLAVQVGIDYLTNESVDYIILPPVYELAFANKSTPTPSFLKEGRSDGSLDKGRGSEAGEGFANTKNRILPLFQEYVIKECFAYSLVGKIGTMGDYADVQNIQPYLKNLEKTYTLSDTQKSIKKFHSPFAYRSKEVSLWKCFLTKLSFSSMMVNRVVKEDLKYFKDAMIDTLIPLNYGYFNYQNTISKFLNFKKIRFHKLEKIETVFQSFDIKASKYSVKIVYTGHIDFLIREKKWMRLLQRGTGIKMEILKIEDGGLPKIAKNRKKS